jgi:hypothetical protein
VSVALRACQRQPFKRSTPLAAHVSPIANWFEELKATVPPTR